MRKIKLRESELITIIKRAINESIINEGKLPQKVIKEQKVFWPDDEGKPVAMERETSDDGNVPEVHRGMDIELIKPRVKDWWRGEEILWDMNVEYDKFDRNEDGVTFNLQNKPVAFYDNNQKTLIIYKR